MKKLQGMHTEGSSRCGYNINVMRMNVH